MQRTIYWDWDVDKKSLHNYIDDLIHTKHKILTVVPISYRNIHDKESVIVSALIVTMK
jgi:hypothetical protein